MSHIRRTLVGLALGVCLLAAFGVGYLGGQAHRTRAAQIEDRAESSPRNGFYVAAADTRLFVQRVGRGDAPAVVFIPGAGAWGEMWRRFMNQVAGLGYQALAIDLPPFGYSFPPRSGDYRKDAQGRRILAALDSLGIHKATFIGHSTGAAPLMEALIAAPQRVDQLILVSPVLGLDAPATDGAETSLQRWLRKPWIGEFLSACCLTNPRYTDALVRLFVAEKDKITGAWIELYQREDTLEGTSRNVARWMPELFAPRGILASDRPDSYRSLGCPVTLVWGTADSLAPLSQGEHLAALFPNAVLTRIPGGHVPMIEEPALLEEVLARTLPRLPPPGPVALASIVAPRQAGRPRSGTAE